MSYNFIIDHALRNVWCTPDQDAQFIIEPARLTPASGAMGVHRVMWRDVTLPDLTSRWHVYQVGQVHPLILGLLPQCNKWTSFAEACNAQKMICDIYTVDGIQLPRFETFYLRNGDKDLIVAVRKNPKIPYDFLNEKIFVRVYTNEYFNTLRSDALVDFIHVEGKRAATVQDILDFQTLHDTYLAKPGAVYSFVNGVMVSKPDLIAAQPGDVMEFVYDSSVYRVVDFKVGDLRVFESTLDMKRKYLLHYPNMEGNPSNLIDYQDDVDVFLIRKFNNTRHQGVYYHKNNEDAMRQVTHRDYSIATPYVARYVPKLEEVDDAPTPIDPHDLYVRLHIRKSGYLRPLVYENNRIHELYKMADVDILRAMLGIDSTVINWRAEVLENSLYTKIMRSDCCDVTTEMVQGAYGYNGLAKVLADTPSKTREFSGRQVIDVPYGLQVQTTAYEYDADGHLLGWHLHNVGSTYACVNNTARYVELISGFGGDFLDEHYDARNLNLSSEKSHRVYVTKKVAGIPSNIFYDATDDTSLHTLTPESFEWKSTDTTLYPMVRSDKRFLAYDLQLSMVRGQIKFSFAHKQTRAGVQANWVMQVPMGELDIFLNGRGLIENLDYIVKFPEVVIINKEYLVNPETDLQNIHVRFTGFCDKAMKMTPIDDAGFIAHGVLSNDKQYDLRDDRVLRIVVDGQLYTREDLLFSEDHAGISILDASNGKPYLIRDLITPMRGMTSEETYKLRDESNAIDKRVAEYLTLKIPEPVRGVHSAIPNRYQIFSPFCNKLIYDLRDGILTLPAVTGTYGRQFVMDTCKSYEYLLAFDPTQEEHAQNSDYVIIHPHSLFTVIDLSVKEYKFMQEVVLFYTNSQVSLSPFIRLI